MLTPRTPTHSSVLEAISSLRSFERRIEKLDELIRQVQEGRLTMEQLVTLQRRLAEEDDVLDSKTADDETTANGREENEASEEALLAGVIAASLGDLVAEREQVVGLRKLAQAVYDQGAESKFEKLREILTDPKFVGEKFIVFTEHKDTLNFLVQRLGGMGYTGQIAQIHGGMHYTERQKEVERFRLTSDGGARFMLVKSTASGGTAPGTFVPKPAATSSPTTQPPSPKRWRNARSNCSRTGAISSSIPSTAAALQRPSARDWAVGTSVSTVPPDIATSPADECFLSRLPLNP